jgi:hypothetical protein
MWGAGTISDLRSQKSDLFLESQINQPSAISDLQSRKHPNNTTSTTPISNDDVQAVEKCNPK